MLLICSATKDTYITNKIIDGTIRATDANVGHAGTLDLFKLYNETRYDGSGSQFELSRLLVAFNLLPITVLTSSKIDLNSSNFKATMQFFDIMTGHAVPRNFTISAYPLSQAFDEGVGRDVIAFNDLDSANFITASYTNSSVASWYVTGANHGGLIGSTDIDYISSGNLNDGNGVVSFAKKQTFTDGSEDLAIDVTTLVSATIAGQISDLGFRLAFTGSEETDQKTRFVKRFASRHVANPLLRPRILVEFDDTIQDNHRDFLFDVSGSIFLNTFVRSSPSNLVSGSNLAAVTGLNSLLVKLSKGTFAKTVTGSQHRQGTADAFQTGIYSASFAIASNDSAKFNKTESLAKLIATSGSVDFNVYWKSLDGTFAYHTGSLKISRRQNYSGNFISREPMLNFVNLESDYGLDDTVRFRIFGRDMEHELNLPSKIPYKLPPIIYEQVYYRVIDRVTGVEILPFSQTKNGTRLSTDADGMFFDFKTQALVSGRSYAFEFKIIERDQTHIIKDKYHTFVIRSA